MTIDKEKLTGEYHADVNGLLAEIERLEERNVYWIDQANTIAGDRNSIRNENDQLKAENAQLKNQEIELKAENEALRKDAERYRFVRKTWCPDWPSEKADAQIDAAMAKEASHG